MLRYDTLESVVLAAIKGNFNISFLVMQATTEGSQVPTHGQFLPSEADQHSISSDIKFDHQVVVNAASRREYPHISQGMDHDSVNQSSDGAAEVTKTYVILNT